MKNIIQNEDQFRLRYPKNDDLGDVLFECKWLTFYFLTFYRIKMHNWRDLSFIWRTRNIGLRDKS